MNRILLKILGGESQRIESVEAKKKLNSLYNERPTFMISEQMTEVQKKQVLIDIIANTCNGSGYKYSDTNYKCDYCGTNYQSFHSNCKNCGGTIK